METPAWGFREEKEGEEEEEEEEKEADASLSRVLSFVPALVVDSGSGTFLVFLVTFLLAQCSLLLTTGSRCSTSWPVWNRRTVTRSSILHLALFFLPCLQAQDARHHGPVWTRRISAVARLGLLGSCCAFSSSPRNWQSTGSHLFAVLFGSTVDTFYVSLQRLVEGALLGQGVLALRCATTGAAVPQLQFLRSLTPLSLRSG